MNIKSTAKKIYSSLKKVPKNVAIFGGLAIITFAISLVGFQYFQKNQQADRVVGFAHKDQAYDFVSLWGTYNSESYPQYTEDLKSRMTPEYYESVFGGDLIDRKHALLTESKSNFITVPIDPVDNVNITEVGDDVYEAVVYAEEESIDTTGESYFDQIAYRVSFVAQNDRLLVSNITADRFSERPPHTVVEE